MRGLLFALAAPFLFAPADGGGAPAPLLGGDPPPSPAPGSPPTGGGGDPPPAGDWLSGLDDAGRGLVTAKGFKSPADLVKSYSELEAFRGRSLTLPGEDAKPEEWQQFYAKLGRPETPDKYEIGRPETFPEALYSKEQEASFRKLFHDAGLAPRQAQALMKGYFDLQAAELQKLQAETEQAAATAEAELKSEFGQAYPAKIELANRALRQFGGDAAAQAIRDAGLGSNPALVRMLAKIGDAIGEAKLREGAPAGQPSKAEAEAEIRKIRGGDKTSPYYDKFHPEHDAAVKRMEELHRIAAEAR